MEETEETNTHTHVTYVKPHLKLKIAKQEGNHRLGLDPFWYLCTSDRGCENTDVIGRLEKRVKKVTDERRRGEKKKGGQIFIIIFLWNVTTSEMSKSLSVSNCRIILYDVIQKKDPIHKRKIFSWVLVDRYTYYQKPFAGTK